MKKIALLLIVFFGVFTSKAQTSAFAQNFNSPGTTNSTTWTTSGTITAGWTVNRSGADWGSRISGDRLEFTNDVGATGNVNGWAFAYVDQTASPFNTSVYDNRLDQNTGLVTWNFNMRQIRSDPSGLAAGNYGVAFVLASSSTSPLTAGDGYAITLGNSGSTDPIRLQHFTSGIRGTVSTMITSNTSGLTDFGANYLSIRVTYDPNTNVWELFLRNDGTSSFTDPTTGTLVSQGTITNSTHTAKTTLEYMGGVWNGSTAGSQTAFFDNISVTVASATPTITLSSNTLTGLSYEQGSGPSTAQTINLSGVYLSPASGNLTVNATGTDYEVSLSASSGYTTGTLSVPYTSSTLSSTPIYVRLQSSLLEDNYNSQNIIISGGTASNETLTVSGSVVVNPPTLSTGTTVTSITATSATFPFTVVATGGELLDFAGIEYSTNPAFANGFGNPVTDLSGFIDVGSYTISETGLVGNTTYYYQALGANFSFLNGQQDAFGTKENFTTLPNVPTSPTASLPSPNQFTASWTAPTGGSALAVEYELEAYDVYPISGTPVYTNTAVTSTSQVVTGLSPTTTYYYRVRSKTSAGTNTTWVEFSTGIATTAAGVSVITSNSAEPDTISSMSNGTVSTINGTNVWQINLYDGDGVSANNDGQSTRYRIIKFSKGASNTVADWSTYIADAKLYNGSTDVSAGGGSVSITADSITITTPIGATIDVADNTTTPVVCTLKVTLANPLPAGADNEIFQFQINSADVVVRTSGTLLNTFSAIISNATKNEVSVAASNLNFTTVPSSMNTVSSVTVSINATDDNGNLDEDATQSVTLSSSPSGVASTSGLTQSLVAGVYSWTDITIGSAGSYTLTATATGLRSETSSSITVSSLPYTSFDNFNRTNSTTIGTPSSGGATSWTESECSGSTSRIKITNNMLQMNNCDTTSSSCGNPSHERVSFDMTGKYATTFNVAEDSLVWFFNMKQSRTSPSGFGSGNYGTAFVLGCNMADFDNSSAVGYAVVIGNSSTDPWRLVYFTAGLSSLGVSQTTNIATVSSTSGTTSYWSFKVRYNPCNGEWSLQARNDGTSAFADPTTIASVPSLATNNIYTDIDLPYLGAAYFHSTSCTERSYFDNISIPVFGTQAATTYSWNTTSGDFNTAANWTPSRSCPRPNDILVFDNVAAVVSNVPNDTIAQLQVINNASVKFSTATANNTLFIEGSTGTDLIVESGSKLIINSDVAMGINLLSGATGSIDGTVRFENTTNSNVSREHRLTVTDASALQFNSGSYMEISSMTGNVFGNSGTSNTVVFNNGSELLQRTGANVFGLSQPSSKVTFDTASTFRYRGTSAPSFVGRTYGNFIYDTALTLTISFGGTDAVSFHSFKVLAGTFNFTSSTAQNINIAGDLYVAASALFTYLPTNASTITFNGTQNQSVTINNPLITSFVIPSPHTLINNKSGGTLSFNKPVSITGNINLTNGIVDIGNNNMNLNGATITGGSSTSYIRTSGTGRVLRTIPNGTSFTFPIGFNPYLPLNISVPAGQPDAIWTVGVSDGITDASSNPETLNAVNYTWDVISSSAVDRPVFTPQWPGSAEASNFTTYRSDARVIMRQGTSGTWYKQITSQTPGVSGSDPYTVSSWGFDDFPASTLYQIGVTHNSSLVVNPLPVEFISFEAEKSLNNVNLTWATAWELNNQGFHVEYSIDGSNWTELEFVAGNGTINSVSRYQTIHRNVNAFGANVLYYRLRQIDFDGTTAFSPVRIVRLNGRTNEGINIRYTADAPVLHYSASQSSKINLRLMSLSGKEVYNSNRTLSAGENLIELPIINPKGIYLLEINNGDDIFIEKVKY